MFPSVDKHQFITIIQSNISLNELILNIYDTTLHHQPFFSPCSLFPIIDIYAMVNKMSDP